MLHSSSQPVSEVMRPLWAAYVRRLWKEMSRSSRRRSHTCRGRKERKGNTSNKGWWWHEGPTPGKVGKKTRGSTRSVVAPRTCTLGRWVS